VFLLAAAMARTPEWRDRASLSRRLGAVFIVLLVATVLAAAIDATGLATRVLAITGAAGIVGLAWRIAQSAPSQSAIW
jgi:threonine/homoserine/homoserine lactone efflux protein